MSKENKLIPELRFPEFKNEGEWKKKKLGDNEVAFIVNEKISINKLNIETYISTENMLPGFTGISIASKLPYTGSFTKFKIGDILISNIRPYLKKIWKSNTIGGASNDVIVFRSGSKVLSEFLEFLLKNETFVNYVMESAKGLKMPRGDKDSMLKYTVFIPSQAEQQKIASCLSSLDEVIIAHSQKLELLKSHKKSLMQNLFPKEGETVPKYRFPEFLNDEGWEDKTLGSVSEFLKGKGISKSDIAENGVLPCIRYGQLYTHYKETINNVISFTNISKRDLVLSKENDVIIPSSGETQVDIATASCVMKDGIALGGDLNIIRSNINGVFLSYYLNNVKKKDIAQMAQGISVVHLYSSQLKNLKIQIPLKSEQQKIASCLSSLDELMSAQREKIEQLKLNKKGLMQGLFPKMND